MVVVLTTVQPAGAQREVSATGAAGITGKVTGRFASPSGCLGCGDLTKYIRADRVWCGWQGNNVIIHVRFRNTSVETVTVDWHPSYNVQDGGSHGTGLTSIQQSHLSGHASRGVYVKQQPQGVPPGSPLATCDPSFSSVDSG